MTTTEPTPEAVEELAQVIYGAYHRGEWDDCMAAARAALAAGYVHLITHLNSLTASQRLELGDALCREAAAMDDEEHIDDTDLCEHGLRFGCEECS